MGILVLDGILADCEHYPAGAHKSHRGLSSSFRPTLERRRRVLCPVTDRPHALPSLHHPGLSGDGPLAAVCSLMLARLACEAYALRFCPGGGLCFAARAGKGLRLIGGEAAGRSGRARPEAHRRGFGDLASLRIRLGRMPRSIHMPRPSCSDRA